MLREELQLLQEQGSYVGEVVKAMDKKKVNTWYEKCNNFVIIIKLSKIHIITYLKCIVQKIFTKYFLLTFMLDFKSLACLLWAVGGE